MKDIWVFKFTEYWDSHFMSFHYSKEGAEKAMELHKKDREILYNKMNSESDLPLAFKWGEEVEWSVEKLDILP